MFVFANEWILFMWPNSPNLCNDLENISVFFVNIKRCFICNFSFWKNFLSWLQDFWNIKRNIYFILHSNHQKQKVTSNIENLIFVFNFFYIWIEKLVMHINNFLSIMWQLTIKRKHQHYFNMDNIYFFLKTNLFCILFFTKIFKGTGILLKVYLIWYLEQNFWKIWCKCNLKFKCTS